MLILGATLFDGVTGGLADDSGIEIVNGRIWTRQPACGLRHERETWLS
jgi:hypothetical protein